MFLNVLLGACSQPCSKRADTILYYYFHIKEQHFKMFYDKIISESIYTKTHQIVPLFNNFLGATCPLNIQYAERSNCLPRLQYNYVYIRNEKF